MGGNDGMHFMQLWELVRTKLASVYDQFMGGHIDPYYQTQSVVQPVVNNKYGDFLCLDTEEIN